MIINGHIMHLYCDGLYCPHKGRGLLTLTGEDKAECKKRAKEAGWYFPNRAGVEVLCPSCKQKYLKGGKG